MSEHRDKAAEAVLDGYSLHHYLPAGHGRFTPAEERESVGEIIKAAEPHLERMYFERFEAQLRECEEALKSEQTAFAEFREEMLKPLQDQGRSIESLSWDELLGVAVRNANECMKAQDERDRAVERFKEAVLSKEVIEAAGDTYLEGRGIAETLEAALSKAQQLMEEGK